MRRLRPVAVTSPFLALTVCLCVSRWTVREGRGGKLAIMNFSVMRTHDWAQDWLKDGE